MTIANRALHTAIESCTMAARVCQETIHHCLSAGGRHAEEEHVRLLLDCADLCETTARLLVRASSVQEIVAKACADVCRRCADDCRLLGDPEMGRCAVICDQCAEACEALLPKPATKGRARASTTHAAL